MGMMQKKAGGLDTLDEMRTSRNSFHLRGISHGSVLKDKQSNLRHAMGGGSSSSVSPVELDHGGIFVHRLSSVPEYKAESPPKDLVVEGAKGLLFSLHLVQSYFVTLLSLASDGESKRSSLERVYYNASTHFEQLNQEIGAYDGSSTQDPRHKKRLLRNIRRACRACAVSYSQVGNLLIQGSRHLLTKADQRYVRTLLLLVYGSTNEGVNAFMNLNIHTEMPKPLHVDKSAPPVIQREVPKLTVRSISPVKERPQPTRRYRSEANNTFRNTSHQKSSTNPQSAVPLHINGRSRSNSRSNIGGSAVSSVANTPRSGESFLIPNAQPLPIFEGGGLSNYQDPTHAALFEKIYLAFKSAVERGSAALPMVNSQFGRCLEASQSKYSNKNLTDLWQRLATRSRQCLDMCEALGLRLSIVKLNDPEVRNSQEFWSHITRYINSFVALVDEIKKATEANKAQLAPLDISRMLKPVHVCVKAATASLRESPWAYVLSHSSPPHSALTTQNQWQNHGHANGQTHGRLNGHHRTRGGSGSGSSSSPYLPTTPLSAALGPAAQATIPSSSTAFDRSFQGDVFQRAESFLNMQQTMLHRR